MPINVENIIYLNPITKKCDDFIDQSFFLLAQKSPELVFKLYKIIMDKKTEIFMKATAINTWFRILNMVLFYKNLEANQEAIRERLDIIEGNLAVNVYRHEYVN